MAGRSVGRNLRLANHKLDRRKAPEIPGHKSRADTNLIGVKPRKCRVTKAAQK